MTVLLTGTAVVMAALGVLWLFFPYFMLDGLLVSAPDAITVYMARRYGALFFGYAAMFWLARASPASSALAAMLAGGTLVAAVIGAVSIIGALTGVVGPAIWGAMLLEVGLGCVFALHWQRSKSQPEAPRR